MCGGRQPVAAGRESVIAPAEYEDAPDGEGAERAKIKVQRLMLYNKEFPKGYLPSDGIAPHLGRGGEILSVGFLLNCI